MKSSARTMRFINIWEWHPWYAWYPVRAVIGDWPTHGQIKLKGWKDVKFRWVWRENIERVYIHDLVEGQYIHRVSK